MLNAATINGYKHTEQEYVDADPFFGEETELTCRTVKLRKAKKEHQCFGLYGDLGHGIRLVRVSALQRDQGVAGVSTRCDHRKAGITLA